MATDSQQGTAVEIRRLTMFDVDEVLAIERHSFDDPWTLEDFEISLLEKDFYGVAAAAYERILGYLIVKRHRECSELLNLAVHPRARRCGIGRALVASEQDAALAIEGLLRERNLAGQLFLRACGFRAVHVVRRPFERRAEDGYLFRWAPVKRARGGKFLNHV